MWVAAAMLVLALGSGFVYFTRKSKLQPVRVRPAQQKERLITELARLDDDFENGKIAEESYHRQRAEKKALLVRLMRQQR